VVLRSTRYRVNRSKKGGIALDNITEMLKGVLEGCVLEIIGRGETYGYEIASSLRALGFVDVVEGTVYTILLRLEKNELVNIEKRPSTMGPPRKFYTLNDAGHAELAAFWAKWDFVSLKINELKGERTWKTS
jgi:PadR family transcriptional regulator